MHRFARHSLWVALVLSCATVSLSCSDANLYSQSRRAKQADRLGLVGRVCTEDPVESNFPAKIVLLVDQAAGPLQSDFDPGHTRVELLRDYIQRLLNQPQTELAIIGYGGRPEKLAPVDGEFTRNPGELFNAVTRLSLSKACVGTERCRDYQDAIRSARTLIEGDLAGQPAGLTVLTQYVVVMINAGPHQPMAPGSACCAPDDVQCIDANPDPSPDCQRQLDAREVEQLREAVETSGAAGFRFHSLQLAAAAEPSVNDAVQASMEAMAFAGGGVFQRANGMGAVTLSALDLTGLRTELQAKLLIAANLNARPGPNGPRVDSDADGLADTEEDGLATLAGTADSDGDGIGDRVEVMTGFDPLVVDTPAACATIDPRADADLDGLSNCDERLLGTDPTLVDTDGDGMPDRLEAFSATDYLNADTEQDTDGDGISNGDELLQHSDPRSTDLRAHLTYGYRYEVDDEGFVTDLYPARLRRLAGVEIVAASPGTTPGVGAMVWDASAQTLRWQDADDASLGPPVAVGAGGTFEVPSSSWAPVQGDDGRFVTVEVDAEGLPPGDVAEQVRVVAREHQCLQYAIRNIQMMPTRPLDDGTPAGHNSIIVYFAQAPVSRLTSPGPVRMVQIPVRFDPPTTRDPDDAVLLVDDGEFVRPRIEPLHPNP